MKNSSKLSIFRARNASEDLRILPPRTWVKILAMVLSSSLLCVAAKAVDEIELTSISFTSSSFTTINGVNFTRISGSGAVNAALYLDNAQTNFIAGGLFTTVYAGASINGAGGVELLVNNVQQNPRVFALVNNLSFSGTPVNYIFRVDWNANTGQFTFSKLTNGYNGTGDGVSYKINVMYIPSGTTKLYVGGMFTSAGGWTNGRGFAIYDFSPSSSGWGQLQYYPMYISGPSYAEVTRLSDHNGDVDVYGSEITAFTDQSGSYTTSKHEAYWSQTNKRFTIP